MKKVLSMLTIATVLLFAVSLMAANCVVVVPLGGAVGDATAPDVIQGKTFSSKAGKGLTGTLELPPCAQSYTNSNNMTFNLIPAGIFTMGSPIGEPGRDDVNVTETQHQVTLTNSFYMQTTEVTQKQWLDVIGGNNPATSSIGNDYPLDTVNWFEAAHFANELSAQEVPIRTPCYDLSACTGDVGGATNYTCSSAPINSACTGYRLPTEAEWEYAARAGTITAYANPYSFDVTNVVTDNSFNSNLAAMGWYTWNNINGGYVAGTKPVAQKQANRWGLYDMHGNVYEWCQDGWDSTDYSPNPVTDPTGDVTASGRVVRGGSWDYWARYERSAYRQCELPDYRFDGQVGIRLVLSRAQ